MNNGGKKIFTLAFWIVIALFGIYMSFFHKKTDSTKNESVTEKQTEVIETENEIFHEAQDITSLPDVENESQDEMYVQGIEPTIYYTNTKAIDEGNLPLEVQATLVNSTQKYLDRSGFEDVTELRVDETSYTEGSDQIAFNCFMDGYTSQLRVVYEIGDSNLKFSIIE